MEITRRIGLRSHVSNEYDIQKGANYDNANTNCLDSQCVASIRRDDTIMHQRSNHGWDSIYSVLLNASGKGCNRIEIFPR